MRRKIKRSASLEVLIIGIMILAGMLLLSFISSLLNQERKETVSVSYGIGYTVVIDAGHGGEDGGSSSASGIKEKDLNLIYSKKLEALFRSAGVKTVMTRTEDKLLYNLNDNYIGRKKILDARERVRIVNECESPVLLSIHMNAFPESKYRGLQVYYSQNDPYSADIAKTLQSAVHNLFQPDNDRKIKAAHDIFIMDRVTSPALLIECGFLSNPEEAEDLTNEEYQNILSFIIFYSVLSEIQ